MNTIAPLRILLVDDHTLFRRGLACLLENYPDLKVIGEASDGVQAIQQVEALHPEVVLMDIDMPNMNGLEALGKIIEIDPEIRIVMLTISDDDQNLFTAIKNGAQGYLLKNLQPDELYNMLNGLRYGYVAISSPLAGRILDEFKRISKKEDQPGKSDQLTAREIEVLKLLALGLTNQEIAESLHVSENTIKAHLRNILDKLHLNNRIQAAIYASKHLTDHTPSTSGDE